jgi:hypothetical protein
MSAVGRALGGIGPSAGTGARREGMPADSWSRMKQMGRSLRELSEELALERRQSAALRAELRRLRSELADRP